MEMRRAIQLNEGLFVPPEYQVYDYLQTYGHNAKIDTGISGNNDTLKFQFIFMPISLVSSYNGVFGNYRSENDHYAWRLITYSNTATDFQRAFYVTCGNGSPGGGGTVGLAPVNSGETTLNKKITANIEYGKVTLTGTRTASYTIKLMQKTENNLNIAIGASAPGASAGGSTVFRIYNSFKIWSHDALVRNYVPVVRKSDNKAGFYDTINYTFNPSIGSMDFVAGNDV